MTLPLFETGGQTPAPCLQRWAPQDWVVAADWQPLIDEFLASPSALQLEIFIRQRLVDGATVYPPHPLRALELTPLAQVRVLILGQDPYHGPGQAEGMAFSVAPGVRFPPSLSNILKEVGRDLAQPMPQHGSLLRWAEQGVLLLNSCLTVEQGQAASHSGRGWEALTRAIVRVVQGSAQPVVFMLWGAHAQALAGAWVSQVQAGGPRLTLSANHPSPLSALRPPKPFRACAHFSQANDFLQAHNAAPILW